MRKLSIFHSKRFYLIASISLFIILVGLSAFLYISNLPDYQDDPQTLEMLTKVFPEAKYYLFDEDSKLYTVFNNTKNFLLLKTKIGYAFYLTTYGYVSRIEILVGLRDKETFENIFVVQQAGIRGAPVKEKDFTDKFIGLKIEDCILRGYSNQVGVDGISGATTTSSAVIKAIREASLEKVKSIE